MSTCEHGDAPAICITCVGEAIAKQGYTLDLFTQPVTTTTVPLMLTPETKRALTKAGRNAKKAIEERDELVRQAVAEGGSLREVGEAVGLSHQAVKFIAHGRAK